jgi:hypothetical protein
MSRRERCLPAHSLHADDNVSKREYRPPRTEPWKAYQCWVSLGKENAWFSRLATPNVHKCGNREWSYAREVGKMYTKGGWEMLEA